MKKRLGISLSVACLLSLLLATSAVAQIYSATQQDLINRFSTYGNIGLTYDAQADQLYYQGAPVKLFVTYKYNAYGQKTSELDFTWFDANSFSTVYLEADWGAYGLMEIRRLDPGVAQAMLSVLQMNQGQFQAQAPQNQPYQQPQGRPVMEGQSPAPYSPAAPSSQPLPSLDFGSAPNVVTQPAPQTSGPVVGQAQPTPPPAPGALNLDAAAALGGEDWNWDVAPPPGSEILLDPALVINGSQHILSLGVTMSDIGKASVSPEINAWLAICDARPGTYVRRATLADGSTEIYVYYNRGGRYPWKSTANTNALNLFFYTTGGPVTAEGYQLLRCTLKTPIPILDLFMDGQPIQYNLTEARY